MKPVKEHVLFDFWGHIAPQNKMDKNDIVKTFLHCDFICMTVKPISPDSHYTNNDVLLIVSLHIMEVFFIIFLPFICADLNYFTVFLQYYITLMGIIIENYVQMHYGNESLGLNVINYHENVTSQPILMFLKSD